MTDGVIGHLFASCSLCFCKLKIVREKLNAVEIDEFLHIPDVDFHSSTVIHLYLTQLQAMTAKLKMAVNGLHSSWIDHSGM